MKFYTAHNNARHRGGRHVDTVAENTLQRMMIILLSALVAVVLTGVGIGTGFAFAAKTATVSLDGKVQRLSSSGSTVADLFKDNSIALSKDDYVYPARNTVLRDDMKIRMETARALTVVVDGKEQDVNTHYDSASEAVAKMWPRKTVQFIGTSGRDRNNEELAVFTPGEKFQLLHDGTATDEVAQTNDVTPEDILDRSKIRVKGLDETRVTFAPGAVPVMQVLRITEENVTVTEEIPFAVETTKDDSKFSDEKVVSQPGVKGSKQVNKTVRMVDGKVESEKILHEKVLSQPVAQKVTVGTKKRPVVLPGGVWGALAQCECGGNPRCNTGNGFYGMYQFTAGTWHSVGGTGLPHENSAEEQTKRAQILQARAGWGQWPGCARKLGLL